MKTRKILGFVVFFVITLAFYLAGYKLYTDGDSRYPQRIKGEGKVVSFRKYQSENDKERLFIASVAYHNKILGRSDTADYTHRITDTTKTRIGREFVVWYDDEGRTNNIIFTEPGDNAGEATIAFVLGGICTLAFIWLLYVNMKDLKKE